MSRPSWDEYFMQIVDAVASRATCNRGKSGAIIVKDKRILTTGYVGAPIRLPHCDEAGHLMMKHLNEDGTVSDHCVRTTHAEQNAIVQAAANGVAIKGATLYCTMEPCMVCAKMIINAGIVKVVCRKRYHSGKITRDFFKQAGIELLVLDDCVMEYDEK